MEENYTESNQAFESQERKYQGWASLVTSPYWLELLEPELRRMLGVSLESLADGQDEKTDNVLRGQIRILRIILRLPETQMNAFKAMQNEMNQEAQRAEREEQLVSEGYGHPASPGPYPEDFNGS